MSTEAETLSKILPGDGHVYQHGRKTARASRAYMDYEGVSLVCEYVTEGYYLPASSEEDECFPVAILKSVRTEEGRVEIMNLLSSQQIYEIEQRIERGWK